MADMPLQECIARLEDLIQDRKSFFTEDGDDDVFRTDAAALEKAVSMLHKIASGEYKPVVHAHWELVSEGAQCNLIKCTHCGRSIAMARNVPLDEWRAAKPYCDQCGALMDGEDSETMPDIIQRLRDTYAENPAAALELLPELFKQYNDGQIEVISSKAISVEDRQDALWCRSR